MFHILVSAPVIILKPTEPSHAQELLFYRKEATTCVGDCQQEMFCSWEVSFPVIPPRESLQMDLLHQQTSPWRIIQSNKQRWILTCQSKLSVGLLVELTSVPPSWWLGECTAFWEWPSILSRVRWLSYPTCGLEEFITPAPSLSTKMGLRQAINIYTARGGLFFLRLWLSSRLRPLRSSPWTLIAGFLPLLCLSHECLCQELL